MQAGAGGPGLTRRALLTGVGSSALAAGAAPVRAQRRSVISGTVFHDRSGTGRRRASDPGIADVMVSNGRDVARTDDGGRWRLPVEDGDTVFVIKPPHWSTPLAGSLPCFSFSYQANAAETDLDAGAIGPRCAHADFALTPSPERAQFEALLFADTQPANSTELAYLRDDIMAAAVGQGAAFGINHGDIVFDAHDLYPDYLRVLSSSRIPWHHCPGNHDIDYAARHDLRSRDTWTRVFGARHYAFQYPGATFILLDNVYYLGCGTAGNPGSYCGRIGPDQLQFVRNVLANVPPDTLIVVSMHIPLLTYQDATSAADNTIDRHALLEVLSTHPHSVSFSGHMHATEHHYLAANEGFRAASPHHHHVLTAASGGWWGGPKDGRGIPTAESPDGNPNGFHVLSVDGRHYATRFVPAPGKAAAQMRALVEGQCTRQPDGRFRTADARGCYLVANVFDGGPRTRVTYELAGAGKLQSMSRVSGMDPFVAQKPWARPAPSSHLWKAALGDLSAGEHHLTVRAVDEYGRTHATSLVIEITNEPAPA